MYWPFFFLVAAAALVAWVLSILLFVLDTWRRHRVLGSASGILVTILTLALAAFILPAVRAAGVFPDDDIGPSKCLLVALVALIPVLAVLALVMRGFRLYVLHAKPGFIGVRLGLVAIAGGV